MRRALLMTVLLLAAASAATAHETRPASLHLSETAPGRYTVTWKVPALGDQVLHLVVVWPEGIRDVAAPVRQIADEAMIERRGIDCGPAGLVGKTLAIDGLQNTMTDVFVRVDFLDGRTQTALLNPGHPSFEVRARVPVLEIAGSYLVLGIGHILGGIDHLLFVLGLILTVRGFGPLVKADTAFTLAHSATLVLSTLGFVRIPQPPVEVIIALSILFLACEMLRRQKDQGSLVSRRPWIVASLFGLLHGFGFAGALSDVGFPDTDLPAALVMFNVGVEVGQLLFIAAVFAVAAGLKKLLRQPPPWWRPATAYALGTTAAFWMIERLVSWR
jgi:hydrogenase/urease accessory protein HupE